MSAEKQPIGVNANKVDLDNLIGRLSKFGKDIHEKLGEEIAFTALDIETDAKRNEAANMSGSQYSVGGIGSNIHSLIDKEKLAGLVYCNIHYAPYIEFGTGGLVKIPAGFEDYALQFKGKGIKEINLPAKPFMYPALFKNTQLLFERLTKILDGLEKS